LAQTSALGEQMKYQIAKQTLALLIGLALWGLCQDLNHVPTGYFWYVFQFAFPLAIGAVIGYLNEDGRLVSLLLFAAVVGAVNFTYVRIFNGPLNLGDAMFVVAYSFATLLPAFIASQTLVIRAC
jgi:hypothetical protein